MNHIKNHLLYFDSLGVKSTATLVKTPDVTILIDPGVAAMQPSFPAIPLQKIKWKYKATWRITRARRTLKLGFFRFLVYLYVQFFCFGFFLILFCM